MYVASDHLTSSENCLHYLDGDEDIFFPQQVIKEKNVKVILVNLTRRSLTRILALQTIQWKRPQVTTVLLKFLFKKISLLL